MTKAKKAGRTFFMTQVSDSIAIDANGYSPHGSPD
jgi:hypothetical protein